MSTSAGEDSNEGVIGRKLLFCPRLQSFETDELIKSCPDCDCFFLYCCHCSMTYYETGNPCHHFRLVFTDGACRLNGQQDATAGIGVVCGVDKAWHRLIPITASMDPGQKRTSQRAELLAALAGVRYMVELDSLKEIDTLEPGSQAEKQKRKKGRKPPPRDSKKQWVIATDSEYVVKGITEWLPRWKVCSILAWSPI